MGPRGPQSPARQPGDSSGPSQLLSFGVDGGWGLRGEENSGGWVWVGA